MTRAHSFLHLWSRCKWIILLLVLTTLAVQFNLRAIQKRGLSSQLQDTLPPAMRIIEEGTLPRTAFYPPLIPVLLAGAMKIGWSSIGPFHFNTVFPGLGLWPRVALTFADTQFKISVEVLLLPAMSAAVRCWTGQRPSEARVSGDIAEQPASG